jgi:hypothetical protein
MSVSVVPKDIDNHATLRDRKRTGCDAYKCRPTDDAVEASDDADDYRGYQKPKGGPRSKLWNPVIKPKWFDEK